MEEEKKATDTGKHTHTRAREYRDSVPKIITIPERYMKRSLDFLLSLNLNAPSPAQIHSHFIPVSFDRFVSFYYFISNSLLEKLNQTTAIKMHIKSNKATTKKETTRKCQIGSANDRNNALHKDE